MDSSNPSFSSSSSLLCQENESSLSELQEEYINLNQCSISESEDEYIQLLIQKERSFEVHGSQSGGVCSSQGESWLKCARLGSINWILNRRAFFGFQFRTAFLSLTYFDRLLSRQFFENGKLWAIRLLSVACLSLAAKIEESEAPPLSDYNGDGYFFESNVIERSEFFVLETLEWKMGSITPFAYLHYFIIKLCLEYPDFRPKELICEAIELIFAITKEINLMDLRPSVIAAVAVLAASDDQLTKKTMELKIKVISPRESLHKEDLYSCYNIMQGIKMKKSKTPDSEALPTNSISTHFLENSSVIPSIGSKRRLNYEDSDRKNHRP